METSQREYPEGKGRRLEPTREPPEGPGQLEVRDREVEFNPTLPPVSMADVARELVFRDEPTALAIVERLWPEPTEWEEKCLRQQMIQQGGISMRLAQARAVMAAVVMNRGRPRPATVRIGKKLVKWAELPEQAKMAWEWIEAVPEARRTVRGDVGEIEDQSFGPLEGDIEDVMETIEAIPAKPPVTKPTTVERLYLAGRVEAKEKGIPQRQRNRYACERADIKTLGEGRVVWHRIKRKAAREGWDITEL